MSRVLIVGWDGGTWSVADPLARAGRLPVLASLRREASEGVLESVPNLNSAPAWSTIVTGRDPGRHGIFYFDERVPGSYGLRIINARRRQGPTLWQIASDAGKRVVVVNVPISFPAVPVNGALVAGLDTPSKTTPGFCHPADLWDRYADLFHNYVIEPQAPTLMRDGRVEEAERALLGSIEGWTSLTERLMSDLEWDLAFLVMTSTDTTQHFFWGARGGEIVNAVYEEQDRATGRLLDLARKQDPETNIVILADHGGAANTRGPEYLRAWLQDQGYLRMQRRSFTSRALSGGFDLVNRKLPRERKRALAARFPRLKQRAESESRLGGIDWRRTTAYSDGMRDDVLVNLVGREPEGTVSPEGYDAFVQELAEQIASIKEAGTDTPVVDSVLLRNEVYQGPFIERAPDLTVRWAILGRAFHGFRCDSEGGKLRMAEISARPPAQPGGHDPEGMFLAAGPNVTAGRTIRGRLADLTPTVLALLGVPLPTDLDGTPLPILRGLRAPVPASADAMPEEEETSSGYTREEEAAIRERLEGLGYV